MITKNYDAQSAGWRVDGPRVRFVALAAAVIAACNVGGFQLSSHFATERNVFGKLLLGRCMIIVPLFHPKWRSSDRRDARNLTVDICAAWLVGLGAETAYLNSLRPTGLRLFDVVGLTGGSIALAVFSVGVAGAATARQVAMNRDVMGAWL